MQNDGKESSERKSKDEPRLTREEFAKISEVDGLRLSDSMREAFEDFDAAGDTAAALTVWAGT